MTKPRPFAFHDPGLLTDGDLSLVVREYYPGNPQIRYVPAYFFELRHRETGENMGHIHLRIGSEEQVYYCGHVGYGVTEKWRGHHFAARATRLVFPLARRHGIRTLWITCNPDNLPSRRTCEIVGGTLTEIVPLPKDTEMYAMGDREKCRYWIDLAKPENS